MYSTVELTAKYLNYYLRASNSKGHGMHSPFVFDFILHVLNNKKHYLPPLGIETLRRSFLKDDEVLQIEEMGAGSRKGSHKQRKVSEIAATALKNKKLAHLLFRTAKHYHPQIILELGTSLGTTAAHLASAHDDAKLITIEGNEAVRLKAIKGFKKLGLTNIESIGGNFDEVLPGVLRDLEAVDLAYIDGNHRYEPTVRYFEWLLEKVKPQTILVFDDIHWSREMEAAWKQIQQHPSVQYTIDVFFLGFVFFRKEFKVRQDFIIRF